MGFVSRFHLIPDRQRVFQPRVRRRRGSTLPSSAAAAELTAAWVSRSGRSPRSAESGPA